jgi:FkbM family methyltransferase
MSVAAKRRRDAYTVPHGSIATLIRNPRGRQPRRGAVSGGEARVVDRLQQAVWATVNGLTSRVGWGPRARASGSPAAHAVFIQEHLAEFEWLYARLADEASRCVLVALLRARLHGQPFLHPTRNTSEYQAEKRRVAADFLIERDTRKPWLPYLNRYCFPGAQGKIVLQSEESAVLHTFVLEQYGYSQDGTTIRPEAGDIVLDGGSHHGVAAIYFAGRVGATGHVYSVELEAGNSALVGENLVLNPTMRDHVTVIERALSDRSGDHVEHRPYGPATCLVRVDQWGQLVASTPTVSIDDLVAQEALSRVDFIKLDIDGWERRVLAGARRTLDTLRPALAVSLSDGLAAMIDIPMYLDDLTEEYDFFLDDVTVDGNHPILFARPAPATVQR